METKTVFVVCSPYYDDASDIYGVFDSKERMDEFLCRFKDRADDFEIREMALNPQFPGDKSRNPYCAPFYSDGRANLFIVYDITCSRILRTLSNLSPLRRCQLALEPIQ